MLPHRLNAMTSNLITYGDILGHKSILTGLHGGSPSPVETSNVWDAGSDSGETRQSPYFPPIFNGTYPLCREYAKFEFTADMARTGSRSKFNILDTVLTVGILCWGVFHTFGILDIRCFAPRTVGFRTCSRIPPSPPRRTIVGKR